MKEAAYKVLENRPNLQEVYQTSDGTVFIDRSYANIHAKVLKTPYEVVTRAEMVEKTTDVGQGSVEAAVEAPEIPAEAPEIPAEVHVEAPAETTKPPLKNSSKAKA
jgi:hypothetical protein